jgi:hypothetical protein
MKPNRNLTGIAIFILFFVAVVLSVGADDTGHGHNTEEISLEQDELFTHIHGIGYTPDGKRITIATHQGIRVFFEDSWTSPVPARHDYMGFAAMDEGFYSSGHPDLKTDLANPLGLVKVTDGGKHLEIIAFHGESDFHLLTVGYYNHTLYLGNTEQNSRLSSGLYHSLDGGQSWNQSRAEGVFSEVIQITAHPTISKKVALVTEDGLLHSDDYAHTFGPIGTPARTTVAHFTPNGKHLIYGFRRLRIYNLADESTKLIQVPDLADKDYFNFVAVNPLNDREIVVVTKEKNIYLSSDLGKHWKKILKDGRP